MVLFPGALGDFICFLPALECLAERAEIDLLARTEFSDLVPARVRVTSLERYEIARLFVPDAAQEERLQAFFSPYQRIYSWTGSRQPDFVRQLELLCGGKATFFPFRPPPARMHVADYYLSCVGRRHAGTSLLSVPLRSEALAWSDRFFKDRGLEGERILVLAPGSGAREKNWPAEFYKVVEEWWERRFAAEAIFLLGPVEEERGVIDTPMGHAQVISGLDLAKVAALLVRCALYLGNDSGVTHLAAALGVETVALFGPSDPVQWAPQGRRVTVINLGVECSPCFDSVMKLCPHRKCLTTLSPGKVIDSLERLLEQDPMVQSY